jgi:type VI secretion system protein ImpK
LDPSAINDPFADRDDQTRTFLKPDPRGRAAARSAETTNVDAAAPDAAIADVGLNPLVALANPLLLLVPQLRATRQVADPARCARRSRRASATSLRGPLRAASHPSA